MIEALTAEGERRVLERVGSALTGEQVRGIGERERRIYGAPPGSGEVRRTPRRAPGRHGARAYLQLLPGYVRRFVEKAAGLLDLEIRGDLDGLFCFVPAMRGRARSAAARVGKAIPPQRASACACAGPRRCRARPPIPIPRQRRDQPLGPTPKWGRGRRPNPTPPASGCTPAKPVFEALSHRTLAAFGRDALRGAIFTDSQGGCPILLSPRGGVRRAGTESEPDEPGTPDLFGAEAAVRTGMDAANRIGIDAESRAGSAKAVRPSGSAGPHHRPPSNAGCWGFATAKTAPRPNARSSICSCCTGAGRSPPGAVPLAGRGDVIAHRGGRLRRAAGSGSAGGRNTGTRCAPSCPSGAAGPSSASTFTPPTWPPAAQSCPGVAPERSAPGRKQTMRSTRSNGISDCSPPGRNAPSPGSMPRPIGSSPAASAFSPHALAVPAGDSGEEGERYDARVEEIAVRIALAWERERGGEVRDVFQARACPRPAGLPDWPGFDLLSTHPEGEVRHIEVKGRAGRGSIPDGDQRMENRLAISASATGSTSSFDCATPAPRLLRIQDPFDKLLARSRESSEYTISAKSLVEAAEQA